MRYLVFAFVWIILRTFPVPDAGAQLYADSDAFFAVDNSHDLAAKLEKVFQESLDRGAPNFVPYSLFLIHQAQVAMERHRYDCAVVFSEYALKFSPDIPHCYTAFANARWALNRLHLHRLLQGYGRAVKHCISPRNIDEFCFFVASNSGIVAFALAMAMFIMAVISMLRYLRLAAHDMRHLLPPAMPDAAVVGCLAFFLLLPLLFGCSLFLSCLYWLIVLFAYHSASERIVVVVATVLCGLLTPILIGVASLCMFVAQNEDSHLVWRVQYRYWTLQDIEALERRCAQRMDDTDALFVLGLVNKREGNYRTALKYYEKLLSLAPQDYRAHNNIGNVFLVMHNWDAAVEHYRQAITLAPGNSAAAHFNLARAYQQRFMFKEADLEIDAAKRIDQSTVDRYLTIYSENYNRMLIDELLPIRHLWERGYQKFLQQGFDDLKAHWNLLYMGPPAVYTVPALIVALCLSGYAARREKVRLATACRVCGRPLCKRCQRVVATDIICVQCLNFFRKQETLGYTLKEEKAKSITKYLRSEEAIGFLSAWLVPGAGYMWKGRPLVGYIYACVFTVLVCKLLAVILIRRPVTLAEPSSSMAEIVFWGSWCILVWVLCGMGAMRCKNDRLEGNVFLKTIKLQSNVASTN